VAGHSHGANVRHRKDRVNALKAKVFSKIARMILVAAKLGGGDPDANPRLRLALEKARAASMPKENVQRAIKKGTGDSEGANYEELLYEGYAAGGVAMMIDILTDNRNRTAPEIRKIFEKAAGSLASSGAVAYMFQRKSIFEVEPDEDAEEDALMETVLESGAEDLVSANGVFSIHGDPGEFVSLKAELESRGVKFSGAGVGFVPDTRVDVPDVETARKIVRLIEGLEENDDVQGVYANHVLTDDIAEELAKSS
jgi:YebC/PmpR family DNA-binding regulatory protein